MFLTLVFDQPFAGSRASCAFDLIIHFEASQVGETCHENSTSRPSRNDVAVIKLSVDWARIGIDDRPGCKKIVPVALWMAPGTISLKGRERALRAFRPKAPPKLVTRTARTLAPT
jgi:hypothetical protein